MKIFMENKQKIAKHNTRFHKGHHAYDLEMNHYGDLLSHEFGSIYNGYRYKTLFFLIYLVRGPWLAWFFGERKICTN